MKVRDGAHVVNKAAHLVVGVDTDGIKHVLGIWVQSAEGAKFWLHVLTELRNRGVKDVLIACCDGLEGLPESIETVWPNAVTQTCVVHLIRACMRYVAYGKRKATAALLKPIYTAVNEQAALDALAVFVDSNIGKKRPGAVAVWERAWERFTPFLAFPPEVRKIIYTTNAIDISSPPPAVLDVQHGPGSGCDRRGGRGYLRAVHDRDRPEVRCSYRRWPRPGRGLSRGRCSVTTTCRSPRLRAICRI